MVKTFGDRGLGRDVIAALADRPADLVVVDCMLFGVMDELRDAGTPYVVLEHLYDAYFRRCWLRGPMGLGMRLKRLEAGRLAGRGARRRGREPAHARPGRCSPPAGSRRTSGRWSTFTPRVPADPAVLVSLSTFRFPKMQECLQTVLDATAGLDARVVVTTGPVVDPASLRPAANHEVHRFVPHAELMPSHVAGHRARRPRDDHAGAGPRPAAGRDADAPVARPADGRASPSSRAGAGRLVSKKIGAEELRAVVLELLADGPHRAAAARLGAAGPGHARRDERRGPARGDCSETEQRRQVATRLDRELVHAEPAGEPDQLGRELLGGLRRARQARRTPPSR